MLIYDIEKRKDNSALLETYAERIRETGENENENKEED